MPKQVEEDIRQSVRNAHPDYDEDRVNDETFAIMNKQGLLRHGKKGRRNRHSYRKQSKG